MLSHSLRSPAFSPRRCVEGFWGFIISIGAAHGAAAFRFAAAFADRVIEAIRWREFEQEVKGFEVFPEQAVEAGHRLR